MGSATLSLDISDEEASRIDACRLFSSNELAIPQRDPAIDCFKLETKAAAAQLCMDGRNRWVRHYDVSRERTPNSHPT